MKLIALALSPQFLKPVTTMGLRGSSLVIKFSITLFIAKFLGLEILRSLRTCFSSKYNGSSDLRLRHHVCTKSKGGYSEPFYNH